MNEQQLQELTDREAIQELRYKFAEGLDYKNWALLGSLVLDEVEADFSVWGIPAQRISREDFVRLFQQSFSRPGLITQHLYSNFRITVEGDTATSKSNFLGQHYIAGFEGGEEFFLRAEYTDNLTRTTAGWKLGGVALKVFYVSGNPAILAS